MPSHPSVLLATAHVKVESENGRAVVVRALLDQGSEMTFITERLSQELRLRRFRMRITISAVGGVNAGTCRHAARIQISSLHESHLAFKTTASILKSLTKYSAASTCSLINWSHLADLTLADPDPLNADTIDILIGADLYGELMLDGIQKGIRGEPSAQNTILGWVLSGPTSLHSSQNRIITVQQCLVSLEQELKKYWEIEEIPRC